MCKTHGRPHRRGGLPAIPFSDSGSTQNREGDNPPLQDNPMENPLAGGAIAGNRGQSIFFLIDTGGDCAIFQVKKPCLAAWLFE